MVGAEVPNKLPIFVTCNLANTADLCPVPVNPVNIPRASKANASSDRAKHGVRTDVLDRSAVASFDCASVTESSTYRRLVSCRMDPAQPPQA